MAKTSGTKTKRARNTKSSNNTEQQEAKEVEVPVVKGELLFDLAAMLFYADNGSEDPFDNQSKEVQGEYTHRAGRAIISLNKMNKIIVDKNAKRLPAEETPDERNRAIMTMSRLIKDFVVNLKGIKCGKCGNTAEVKVNIFPCEELAHFIWNGGRR